MLMTFLSRVMKSNEETELNTTEHYTWLSWPCSHVGKSLEYRTSLDVKITFMSLNPDVCILFSFNGYVVFADILIQIQHFFIVQLYVSKLPCELIPK
jgi:hypothetical protein